jgi:hypothetical protein
MKVCVLIILKELTALWRQHENRCTQTNEVWYNERSWTCLQVLFESLSSLTEFLNMAMVDFQTSEMDAKNCTTQRGTLKFCKLANLQRMNNI